MKRSLMSAPNTGAGLDEPVKHGHPTPVGADVEYPLMNGPDPSSEGHPSALYGTGKVNVKYEHVLGTPEMGRPGWKLAPTLGKLATGKLELVVKDTGKGGEKEKD